MLGLRRALGRIRLPTPTRFGTTIAFTAAPRFFGPTRPDCFTISTRILRAPAPARFFFSSDKQTKKEEKEREKQNEKEYRDKTATWVFFVLCGGFFGGCCLANKNTPARACGIVGFVGSVSGSKSSVGSGSSVGSDAGSGSGAGPGSVSQSDPAVPYLLAGLRVLQNRGYDSAGIATITSENKIECTKFASVGSTSDCLELLEKTALKRHAMDTVGIAHTRWATHGARTNENAHPHLDSKSRVALVHNGTIENADALRSKMLAREVVFRSETDSEVIVQLIGCYLDDGFSFMDALKKTLAELEGTWGLVLFHRDSLELVACRNGSPLVVGIGKSQMFVASEPAAFSQYTTEFIALKDGEIVVLGSGVPVDVSRVEFATKETIELSPAPFAHWTLKEIMDQPEAVRRTLNYGARLPETKTRKKAKKKTRGSKKVRGVHNQEVKLGRSGCKSQEVKVGGSQNQEVKLGRSGCKNEVKVGGSQNQDVKLGGIQSRADDLLKIKHLVISACGTSYFAAMYGAKLMQSLSCFDTVVAMDASEVVSDSFPRRGGGLCVVSQSGETKDTHRSLQLALDCNLPVFSVVNQVGSLIARSTGCGLYLNAGREHGVASTKAFTTQVAALALIAGWFSSSFSFSDRDGRQQKQKKQKKEEKKKTQAGLFLGTRTRPFCLPESLIYSTTLGESLIAKERGRREEQNPNQKLDTKKEDEQEKEEAQKGTEKEKKETEKIEEKKKTKEKEEEKDKERGLGVRRVSTNKNKNKKKNQNQKKRTTRTEMLTALRKLPECVQTVLETHSQCKEVAKQLRDAQSMFVLGKGFGEPIAYEAALKIKEITYVHAEGFSGGALKHGPFALLTKNTPVVLLILDDRHAELMRTAAHEVKARDAFVIVVTDKPGLADKVADVVIPIPSNGALTALLAVIPLQLIAYELAILKGHNPDKPRNLAKAVTVD